MKAHISVSLATLLACGLASTSVLADGPGRLRNPVAGQKLDSGLGELPHYRFWTDKSGKSPVATRVAGEKLDSGLGDIAPYSLGRNGLPKDVEVAQKR
jgi:hypothetical protein